MILARVLGNVVSPVQHPFLSGRILLSLRPVDPEGRPNGAADLVAIDKAQAGPGDLVLVLREGSSARDLYDDPEAPVRSVVVGVVDEWELDGHRWVDRGGAERSGADHEVSERDDSPEPRAKGRRATVQRG